ncbi:tannase and feruloyl esterase [Diplodia corticola]|uniref:Carboxylic ester hydrolase n=1 Tax=Diplodia corticola TaxID=236234 RepID=A0A1J9QJV2_9PEZI|nr:tannase and feruloyl esterase [Diplodia corticola]OJD29150.1 tannase and feruloyl esterase [Diplodia corticola]
MPQDSWLSASLPACRTLVGLSIKKATSIVSGAALLLLLLAPRAQAQSSPFVLGSSRARCAELKEKHPPDGDIVVTGVTFIDAFALNVSGTFNTRPFCRLASRLAYGSDDVLNFEVWLPDNVEYNGRYLAVGNGGMAGTIDNATMVEYLNEGFAVAGGDSGHLASENNGGDGAPGTYLPYLHDLEQVLAWIHNSIALFTPPARDFIKTYYGREAEYSYYYGCSTGGAQGFALSQLHPGLFDGIYAGCPGFWYSHLALSFLWNGQHTEGDAYLSQSLLNTVTSAALDQCDGLDGVVDRLLENPLACNFSINALACDNGASNSSKCLSVSQLAAAKAIYAGPRDVRDSSTVYPGFSIGSESEWAQGQEGSLADAFSVPILQNLVYDNLTYESDEFDWGSDIDDVDSKAGVLIDETSTDLRAFRKAGSKMLVSQGWADPYNAATLPIEYLKRLEAFFGGDVSDFFNLYMVPGGGHCGGASSYPSVPAKHRVIAALQAWVELGIRPEYVLSEVPEDGSSRTRKLCPWPETAHYVAGDESSATSYICR